MRGVAPWDLSGDVAGFPGFCVDEMMFVFSLSHNAVDQELGTIRIASPDEVAIPYLNCVVCPPSSRERKHADEVFSAFANLQKCTGAIFAHPDLTQLKNIGVECFKLKGFCMKGEQGLIQAIFSPKP